MGWLLALQGYILLFLLVLLIIQYSNRSCIEPFPRTVPSDTPPPLVSILVPARDEEDTIGPCVQSLLQQRYEDYEVIVLDDHSLDSTRSILETLRHNDPRLRIVDGQPLPDGWYGKHWACHQLGQQAQGEILLFTDADTVHEPGMLAASVALHTQERADLTSAFVHQEMLSVGELLTVSFPMWSILTLLPFFVGLRWKVPAFSAANGQFMMFSAESYRRIGGHASVRNHAVDDVALARRMLQFKLNWRMQNGVEFVHCRMYQSFRQALSGFTKNYFALFDYRIIPTVFVWTWMLAISWIPLMSLLYHLLWGSLSSTGAVLAVAGTAVNALLWIAPGPRFGLPRKLGVLYPIVMLLASVIGFRSLIYTLKSKAEWKGRKLARPKTRWF